jgi:hypothetical protein
MLYRFGFYFKALPFHLKAIATISYDCIFGELFLRRLIAELLQDQSFVTFLLHSSFCLLWFRYAKKSLALQASVFKALAL